MRNKLLCFSALGLCVLFLSNFKMHTNSFIFTVVNEEPVLPEVAFSYDDVKFPEHLLSEDIFNDDSGYRSAGVDSLAFDLLDNDKATLGRVLFYDKKLSALENISCANCHRQSLSFAENKQFSEGISAPTRRNSMQLNDIAWTNNDRFFWDMSQTDLHEMIVLPLTDENEIGANMNDIALKLGLTNYYPELFENAYGDQEINEERVVDALVNFISSMTTFNSRFDKEAESGFEGFTSEEKFGQELFAINCSMCHVQGRHTDFFIDFPTNEKFTTLEMMPFLFNNGLPEDPNDHGAGEWDENFSNLFKLPSLRNIELTAPYMHDGRFASLEEVVDFYSDEVVANGWEFFIPDGGFGFGDEEKAALVSFMKTLTDDSFLTNERWSDPFGNAPTIPGNSFDDLVIKPNPFSEQSILEFDNSLGKLTSINIYNSNGRLIKHDNFSTNTYAFNKTQFNAGIYILEIIQGDRRQTQKLIVN